MPCPPTDPRPPISTPTALAGLVGLLLLTACGGSGGGDTPTQPTAPPDRWGFLGCSQTRDAVEGYGLVGGSRSWPPQLAANYGNGHVLRWANLDDPRWADFQQGVATYGAFAVWFQVCIKDPPTAQPEPEALAAAETIAGEIARRLPGVVIYASGSAAYDGIDCVIASPEGVAAMQAAADHLVAVGLAQPGPVLQPLTDATTVNDDCHANEDGKRLHGMDLLGFFG